MLVNVALGNAPASDYLAGDRNRDGETTIDEILAAVINPLHWLWGEQEAAATTNAAITEGAGR